MTSFAELNTKKDDGDPLITLENLADMNEILAIRVENERRAHKHAEKKSHTTRK